MDAKTRVLPTLRVELLEGRFLLSGAGPGAAGASEPLLSDPPDGDPSRPVRVAALPASFVASALALTAQNWNDHDGDDGTPTVPAGANTTGAAHVAGRPQFPVPEPTERPFDDQDAEPHSAPQIAPASAPQDRPRVVPPNPTNPPGATGPAGADHPEATARVGDATDGGGTPGPSGADGVCAFVTVSMSPAAEECDRAPIGPPALDAHVRPGARTTPTDSDTFDWRGVILDPLVGIPVWAVAELNLAALGTETETLLAHLTDPGPEWTVNVEWGECVCLAAGVLLVGGGAYLARNASRSIPLSRALPAPLEGAP